MYVLSYLQSSEHNVTEHETQTNLDLQAPKRGFLKTGAEIVKRETALGLYKGLGAVLTGIVPKMAIRFTSYEWYKQMLADKDGVINARSTFLGESIHLQRSYWPEWIVECCFCNIKYSD